MSAYYKEIKKIIDSNKYPNKKVCVFFKDGTFSLRNMYEYTQKHGGVITIKQNYRSYVIYKANPMDEEYEFYELTEEQRKEYGIKEDRKKKEPEEQKVKETDEVAWDPDARHEKFELIKSLVSQDIPVYLHGPAGSGKNYTIQKIAEELELDFYFVNSIQESYKITGFIDGRGHYNETEFYKAFTEGGLFFLDEMDASIPEVLVLLNAAIANRYFSFPNGQVEAHPDFRCIAAGNTIGSGADDMYTGRAVIDISSVDRFCIVEFTYDKDVELSIAKGNIKLVNFVRECRRVSSENGMRMVFSYRAIEMVTKMEQVEIPLKTILEIGVFKGMTPDEINMFNLEWNESKYNKALRSLQRA